MPGKHGTVEERFWVKVDRTGGEDACWEWRAGKFPSGYGVFAVSRAEQSARAHRISWRLTHGDAGSFLVLHKCDNKGCVNPKHLYLGDNEQNMKDSVERGRHRRGSNHPKAKLTDQQVLALRNRYAAGGCTMEQLSKEYGINEASTRCIIHKLHWRHL